ncbi:mu-protocadherin-putative cell-suface protein [Rhodopirellula sp. SWK7]|nr:mu-protocadherin-putative cell-suface protein [Rhodopirellula sp. SWK7]
MCRWHYYHRFNYYPWNYWWRRPTWAVAAGWFAWTAPQTVWEQPIYYDYGSGGNVTYQDNRVYINDEPVATADEFAQSAAALATVVPPESDEAAEEAEWLPLGTFALSTDEDDVDPTRVVQLAVDKSGIISGTVYNRETDKSLAVQGRVDKNTQRVAMRFGDNDEIVAETGLYNLTEDNVPLLVHFGSERVENYVLVRLDAPEDEDDTTGGEDSAAEAK